MAASRHLQAVGGYQLLTSIGSGGMGHVYLARREIVAGHARAFAVKVLQPDLVSEPTVAEQLLDEARIAATIRHPNVVEVVEAAVETSGAYLVMEYVEGDALAGLLREVAGRRIQMPLPIVGRIFLDALAGLAAAHEALGQDGRPLNLVHRDFSPQNLLVGVDGRTRLADFGIARAVGRSTKTTTGVVKGKIRYMAPEQALGRALDGRCDVWSAAVTLWEAVTGRRVFPDENDAAVVLELLSGAAPPPMSSFRRGVPRALDALVEHALQRDVSARVATARELEQGLRRALEPVGIASHEEVAGIVREFSAELLDRTRRIAEASAAPAAEPLAAETTTRVLPRARPRWFVVPGVVLVALIAGAGLWSRAPATPAHARALALAVPADLGLAVASTERDGGSPSTAAEAASAGAPAGAPKPTVLSIEADAKVVQVRLDDAPPLVLPDPTRRLQVPLVEGGRRHRLAAKDGRGREVVVDVAADQTAVRLSFAGKPAARTARPAARPAASRRVADEDRVLPSP